MPITSYTIKTALIYILAHTSSSQLILGNNGNCEALRNALDHVAGKHERKRGKLQFKKNNPPKWTTEQDLQEHGEEARVWAEKIFSLIKHLAERGWKLNSYWKRSQPIVKIRPNTDNHLGYRYREGFGEAEYICDVCDCALDKLKKDTFFA